MLPYLLCLVVGLLLIAGLVFVVESIHVVMTDAYFAKRAAAKGAWVPYQLFGRTFEPLGLGTWAIPIVLLGAGALLLPMARRVTAAAWLLATQESPPVDRAASAPATVRQEATA